MTMVTLNEGSIVPTRRSLGTLWLVGFLREKHGSLRKREKNLVNRCCEYLCAHCYLLMMVFEVGISRDLEGLHSLVRLATFNRDKNLISEIWAGVR